MQFPRALQCHNAAVEQATRGFASQPWGASNPRPLLSTDPRTKQTAPCLSSTDQR